MNMEWQPISAPTWLIVASKRKVSPVHVRRSCGVERDDLRHHIVLGRSQSCDDDRDAAAVRVRRWNRLNPFSRNAWQRAHGIGRLLGDWEVVGASSRAIPEYGVSVSVASTRVSQFATSKAVAANAARDAERQLAGNEAEIMQPILDTAKIYRFIQSWPVTSMHYPVESDISASHG
jgi:hypothetical protein